MKVSVGVMHVTSNFSKLSDDVKQEMTALIKGTTELVAQEYKEAIIAGAKSGRHYGEHVASAPGESPADFSHELVNSVQTSFPALDKGEMRVKAIYGRMLEFGTKRLAARPTLRPIMEYKGQYFKRQAERLIRKSAKAAKIREAK